MADTFTPALNLNLMAFDSHPASWGDEANENFNDIDKSVAQTTTHSVAGGTIDLGIAEVLTFVHRVTGDIVSPQIFRVPAAHVKAYLWINDTTGTAADTVTVKVAAQPGIVIPRNEARLLRCNGTDVVDTGLVSRGAENGKSRWIGTLSRTAGDVYSAPANPYLPGSLHDGLTVVAFIDEVNTTSTSKFNYAESGDKGIVRSTGMAIAPGELADGMVAVFVYKASTDKWYVNVNIAVDVGAVTGDVVLSGVITANITANQNNYAPTGFADASTYFLTSDQDRTITGLDGGVNGKLLIIHNNNVASDLILSDSDSASDAGNRFQMGDDLVLGPKQGVLLNYQNARWHAVGGSSSGLVTEYDKGVYNTGATLTQAHGLGAFPSRFEVWLECMTTDNGYAPGDRVPTSALSNNGGGDRIPAPMMNITNCKYTMPANAPYLVHLGAGTESAIAPGSWHVIFRVWK